MMARFNMIWIASHAMQANYFAAAANGESNMDENDLSIRTNLSSHGRRQQDGLEWLFQSLPLVSDTCRNGMEVLYQSSALQVAYTAYAAAERKAFQVSCDDVPRDGVTPNYDCDVKIDPPSLIGTFERACVAAGGNVQDFGGTRLGIECCGEAYKDQERQGGTERERSGTFLTYGYHTLDQRSCVVAAKCTADEASRFYQQGMSHAGTQVFQDELGLVCGMGCECGCIGGCPDQCPPDYCASETAEYTTSLDFVNARSIYYTAIADAVVTCLQEHKIDPTNFDCGEITVDAAEVRLYKEACNNVGGLLTSSEPVDIDCSNEDSANHIRITFEGTLTCISPGCDLDAFETKDLIAENTKDSPAAVIDAIDTSMCYDTLTSVAPLCHGYITGRESFIPEARPQPIPCGTSQFGDSVFPSFTDLSCCSGDGRYFVWTGQTGGFVGTYADTLSEPACYAFAEALTMVLCDPRQGDFIDTKNVLRICRSSCDMVFDVCGPPGDNFPEWTGYADGTSLCYGLFGGFGSSPCEGRKDGYVCQSGLTIEVITDDQNCLDIVVPTKFDEYGQSPDACVIDDDDSLSVGFVVGLVVGALLVCLLLCCLTFLCIRRVLEDNGIAETSKAVETNVFVETPAVAIENPPVTDNANDPLPIIHAVAFLEPTLSSTSDDNPKFSNPPAEDPALASPLIERATAVPTTQVVPLAHVFEKTESHNQVRAVRQWMQDNPAGSEALTPEDTAKVLSQVTFSLNQVSMAEELAVGIGSRGKLTCAHIVAAMKECSLPKINIAECMVPYVNDPHNKDAVLSEIELLSERDAVAKGFRR